MQEAEPADTSIAAAGDSACWLPRVCTSCGALVEEELPASCWRCGERVGAE